MKSLFFIKGILSYFPNLRGLFFIDCLICGINKGIKIRINEGINNIGIIKDYIIIGL